MNFEKNSTTPARYKVKRINGILILLSILFSMKWVADNTRGAIIVIGEVMVSGATGLFIFIVGISKDKITEKSR